ncbi:MAG: acetate--CoA ligase family protein [Desulfobacterales bacterium]
MLNEHEAKERLRSWGIPVVDEVVAHDEIAAGKAAGRLGFPVVVKGYGDALLHKTEKGAVVLNLHSVDAVREAVSAIRKRVGEAAEGFLVQPQLEARRELVVGLSRDADFGPVVMIGWGGVFTEALADMSFRLAPLEPSDAGAMIDEIRASRILGHFRGDLPANRESLIEVLLSVSRAAMAHPEIEEVDINPLLVLPDGRPMAVDALIATAPPAEPKAPPVPVPPRSIGDLFHPRSIAFVGASGGFGKWGHMLVSNTIGGGYAGEIFLVNPKGGHLFGRPVYPSVEDLPAPVDLAVVTIPADRVLQLIPQLASRSIRNAVVITSGFGETGKTGRQLEADLVREARKYGILILGPNTMGICNPHRRLYCTGSPVFPEPGSTAIVAQSGNMGTQLLAFAEQQGIGIRGFAGSGNEAMLTIEDYLDGFEHDELTRTVMLYVESVKQGRRFFESARRVGFRKPVVLLKGGQSPEGNRAAASHTGAMATDTAVFDAMCRQAGIVKVDLPMELLDLAAAFSALPLPRGNRIAIMTLGGGWGVVTADLCSRYGLTVPALSEDLAHRLDQRLPYYWSRSNPVDIVGETDLELPFAVMEELLRWDGCDAIVHLGILGRRIFVSRLTEMVEAADPGIDKVMLEEMRKVLVEFEQRYVEQTAVLMERYRKPIVGVRLLTAPDDRTVYPVDGCRFRSVFYETPERAVRSLARMVNYERFTRGGK